MKDKIASRDSAAIWIQFILYLYQHHIQFSGAIYLLDMTSIIEPHMHAKSKECRLQLVEPVTKASLSEQEVSYSDMSFLSLPEIGSAIRDVSAFLAASYLRM